MHKHKKITLQRNLKLTLVILALIIAVLHIFSVILNINSSSETSMTFLKWFDLDNEANVPTVYSGLLLGCCAYICLVLTNQKNNLAERLRWIFLSLLFFYLAFDELLVIHETIAEPLRDFFSINAGNSLYHAWVIPGLLAACLIAVLSVLIKRRNQISRLQKHIFLYIAILAIGVISLEIIGTKLYFSTTIYKLGPVLVEEMFEISMTSLILYKLTMSAFKLPGSQS